MLVKMLVFPIALVIAASAAYEVWVHIGVPVTQAEAKSYTIASVPVRIVPSSTNSLPDSFTYENQPFGFSLSYPRTMVRASDPSLGWSYDTTVKNGALLLSLSLPPQAPYVRDGGIAVLRVGVANDPATVGSCTKATQAAIAEGSTLIGGESFARFSYPSEGIESYRASRGGTCYALEIQVRSNSTTISPSEAAAAKDLLESVVASFTFS